MRLLVSGCTTSLSEWHGKRPDRLGFLLTPDNRNKPPTGMAWAADNGCFHGLKVPAFLRMLAKIHGTDPLWVAAPDVVANARSTIHLLRSWSPVIRAIGFRVAFVGQDGLAVLPERMFDAFFIGGSTEWKLGPEAARLSLIAHEMGKPVHWGRVNTLKRMAYLARGMVQGRLWCDTFDGSSFSRYGSRIGKAVRWMDRAQNNCQLALVD